ncbi:hypothetical protein N5079_13120 [Planotetraspora sp. A-T 1434]|uniref:hypothetical protein n=1 Tax=Planotetraspora sp. A-T 1434 TaxID=2979219 RepID=UPI0021BE83A6|nr:hypothetical protein [Planotetraspora sp. A-T 1434]MCT9931159.1 hypothetical protein [Planotetraspora sp. A-T 1434]
MNAEEIRKPVRLKERHFWHRERRVILAREAHRLGPPVDALEIGAANGVKCEMLNRLGWNALAPYYHVTATEIARERGLEALRADTRALLGVSLFVRARRRLV